MNPRVLIITETGGIDRIIADGDVGVFVLDVRFTGIGVEMVQLPPHVITCEQFSNMIGGRRSEDGGRRTDVGPTSDLRLPTSSDLPGNDSSPKQTQVAPPAHTPEPAASHNAPPVLFNANR